MSIIEQYKREAAKGVAQTIAIFEQNQKQQSTSKNHPNFSQPPQLIQQIDSTTVQQQSSPNYQEEQFEYFSKLVKQKPIKCVVCNKQQPKYTCPKCMIRYCSIAHYKSHNLFCTQNFFKQQVQHQLKTTRATKQQQKKMAEMIQKNKQKMAEDQDQLMQQVQIQEISEQRLNQILQMLQNDQEVNLSDSEIKSFQAYFKEIQYANMQKEGSNVQELNSKQNFQELNPFLQYKPFWLIEQGLQQYFLVESAVQVEDYHDSNHKDIIDYRQLSSQLLRQDLQRISSFINFNKTSPFINYQLIQVIYLTALLFRSFNGEYLKNQQFIDIFLSVYDQNLAKKLSQTHPQGLFQKICQEISVTPLIKSNLQHILSSKKDLIYILITWIPFILEDCSKILHNKYLCLQTLFRMLQAFKSVSSQSKIKWTDEAMQNNKQIKIEKLSPQQKLKQKSLIKIIKKIQFLLTYANEVVYKNQQSETPSIRKYDNKLIIQSIIETEIKRQKKLQQQILNQTYSRDRQKEIKLNDILIPK